MCTLDSVSADKSGNKSGAGTSSTGTISGHILYPKHTRSIPFTGGLVDRGKKASCCAHVANKGTWGRILLSSPFLTILP